MQQFAAQPKCDTKARQWRSCGVQSYWLLAFIGVCLMAATSVPSVHAFQSLHHTSIASRTGARPSPAILPSRNPASLTTQRYIFGRDKEDDNKEDSEAATPPEDEKQSGGIPFFSRFLRKDEEQASETAKAENVSITTAVMEKPSATMKQNMKELSPVEQAKLLRAQAEKTRLEAERMDAELTLKKITKLERELVRAKKLALTSNTTAPSEVEHLKRELDVLQAKMRGETIAVTAPSPTKTTTSNTTTTSTATTTTTPTTIPTSSSPYQVTPRGDYFSRLDEFCEAYDEEVYQDVVKEVQSSPSFLKKAMAAQVGVEYTDVDSLNVTLVAQRLDMMRRLDFSFGGYERPSFDQKDIDNMIEGLRSSPVFANGMAVDLRLKDLSAGNETEWALMALEYQYFTERYVVREEQLTTFVEEDEFLGELMSQFNVSAVDGTIEQFFPKCTRKEGQDPTEADVNQLMNEVLPKAKFTTTAKPEKVSGGYVIRGNSRYEKGDDLIEAIDEQLAKTPLADKMTVLYTRDFTVFSQVDELDDITPDLAELDPIIYVLGKDIVREPRRIALSLTSGLGLATCWYLSLYPFLLNPALASRVDEELALVDAGMTPDLSWLTDLSVPLFATFVGIQLAHELGHRLVAALNGVKPTFPTFVPSIITGVTTTVTTFKEPPKNLQAMFDFSAAGPLFGMIASLAAIAVGAQLGISADPSTLPSMPLEILRQSSLGGGILDAVLGNGVLSVPDGALGTSAVAQMTIPLHPVAVAGFIGLIVNALNVLPIGTTDGGRMAQTLFGRGAKLIVGNLFLLATLFVGIGGSDLFLFYFAFCIAFQTGNEIPARNEADDVDFSRIFVALTAYLLALLSLIPIQ